jgi:type I restriction enzyme S subunit
MKNESHGSTMLHVTKGGMEKLLIQLPPLPEQQKIAEILSTADDKIDIIDQRITETQQLKKGLMQRLLSKGIGHTKFKKSPLGDIPESWEQLKLGKLISIKHGFAFAGSNFTTIKNNNVLLTPGNFASNGGIKFDWNKQKYYSGEFPPEYILKEGDLIVAMTDLTRACVILGAPAIIPNSNLKYLHNQRLGLVNIGDLNRLCKNYLFHYFNYSIYRDYLRNSATGTTVSHTSPKTIYEVNLILPPLPEQQKIASILSSVDDKLEVLSEKKINYQELKKGLMQQLLTGKIRVKF